MSASVDETRQVFADYDRVLDEAQADGVIEGWRELAFREEDCTRLTEVLVRGVSEYYSDTAVPVRLRFSYLLPRKMPQLFVAAQVRHFMVAETGDVSELAAYELRQAWKRRARDDNNNNNNNKGGEALRELLASLRRFFSEPLVVTFPDEVIEELLDDHPPDCRCAVFPINRQELDAAGPAERQAFFDGFRAVQAQRSADAFAQLGRLNLQRRATIRRYRAYGPHCPELFADDDVDVDVRALFEQRGWLDNVEALTEESPGVHSFGLFTPQFCAVLTAELARYRSSGLPSGRPNSMNNYGLVLDDIGLEPFCRALIAAYLQPIAARLFPQFAELDSHHVFVVQYAPDADTSLDMHTDDSEVTFNVNIDAGFTGSALLFCGMAATPDQRRHALTYQHSLGRCVVHLGAHRHGAAPIVSGGRTNLIIWCRSSAYRRQGLHLQARQLIDGHVDQICLSKTHDPDYLIHQPNHSDCEQHHSDCEQHHSDFEQHHSDFEQHHSDFEHHHSDFEQHHGDCEHDHDDCKHDHL